MATVVRSRGALEIADLPDGFFSVELTAWFRDAPQAVHVRCYGITTYDHGWLQRHDHDIEVCAAYLHEHSIRCALVDPCYAVAAPVTASQRLRLAELFPVWCGGATAGRPTQDAARRPSREAAGTLPPHSGHHYCSPVLPVSRRAQS